MDKKSKILIIKALINAAYCAPPPEKVAAIQLFHNGITEKDLGELKDDLMVPDDRRIPVMSELRLLKFMEKKPA